jgi:hypothetical protein
MGERHRHACARKRTQCMGTYVLHMHARQRHVYAVYVLRPTTTGHDSNSNPNSGSKLSIYYVYVSSASVVVRTTHTDIHTCWMLTTDACICMDSLYVREGRPPSKTGTDLMCRPVFFSWQCTVERLVVATWYIH